MTSWILAEKEKRCRNLLTPPHLLTQFISFLTQPILKAKFLSYFCFYIVSLTFWKKKRLFQMSDICPNRIGRHTAPCLNLRVFTILVGFVNEPTNQKKRLPNLLPKSNAGYTATKAFLLLSLIFFLKHIIYLLHHRTRWNSLHVLP